MKEAFVYKWYDGLKNMYYIGVHKGDPNDGYICSSKLVLEQYNIRPYDFNRTILKYGTLDEMLEYETALLKFVNAKENLNFYNQHNGDGKFINKGNDLQTRKKISESLKKYVKTEEHRKNLGASRKGKTPWNKGIPCSNEQKKKLSEFNTGKTLTMEHRQKISMANKGCIPWNKGLRKEQGL